MKTFKEFSQMLDEDGGAVGIGGGGNCVGSGAIAGVGIDNSSVGPNQGEPPGISKKQRKMSSLQSPVLQPIVMRKIYGQISK